MPADEDVPPRVLAAERRREFRELLGRSSLGCRRCNHMLVLHGNDGWDDAGEPINRRCTVAGCDCGRERV